MLISSILLLINFTVATGVLLMQKEYYNKIFDTNDSYLDLDGLIVSMIPLVNIVWFIDEHNGLKELNN